MARIERHIVIQADTDSIDHYALDANTYPQWFAGVESVEVDSQFPEVGGKAEVEYKSAGMTFHLTMTSASIEKGEHFHINMEGMISGTQNWHYESEGDGTRVYCVFDYQMRGGGLGAIADKLVAERMNRQNLEKSLDNLKAIVEG